MPDLGWPYDSFSYRLLKRGGVANFRGGRVKFAPITLDVMGNGRAEFGDDRVIIVGVAVVQSRAKERDALQPEGAVFKLGQRRQFS